MSKDMYNQAFRVNAMSVIMRKSNRKNAMCSDVISVNHMIGKSQDRKIDDDSILYQFINTIEKIVYQAIEFNNHLELSVYADIGKNTTYTDVNKQPYHSTEILRYHTERVKFSSIENCINFMYSQFYMIYPYNELNLSEIHNDPSIRYLISLFHHGTGAGK